MDGMHVMLYTVSNLSQQPYTMIRPLGDERGGKNCHWLQKMYFCSASKRLFLLRGNESHVKCINTILLKQSSGFAARPHFLETWNMEGCNTITAMCGDAQRCLFVMGDTFGKIQIWCTARATALMVIPPPNVEHAVREMCLTRNFVYVFAENYDLLAWRLPPDLEVDSPPMAVFEKRVAVSMWNEILSIVPNVARDYVVIASGTGSIDTTDVMMWHE